MANPKSKAAAFKSVPIPGLMVPATSSPEHISKAVAEYEARIAREAVEKHLSDTPIPFIPSHGPTDIINNVQAVLTYLAAVEEEGLGDEEAWGRSIILCACKDALTWSIAAQRKKEARHG